MTFDHPVAILEQEHQFILAALDAIERKLQGWPAGEAIDVEFWGDVNRFLRDYADGWHHHKEEELLFPVLETKNLGCGPVPVMLSEHVQGRALRAEIEQATAAGDREALTRAAQGFVMLLRDHILKEDNVLFQMARRMVDPAEIQEAFERAQNGEGAEQAREFEQMVRRWSATAAS